MFLDGSFIGRTCLVDSIGVLGEWVISIISK